MTTRLFPSSLAQFPLALLGCGALLIGALRADGVLFFSTDDPTYNTNAPTKTLTNSGWQFQGTWGLFSGTVISPNCFITSKHLGGAISNVFVFRRIEYPTVAFYDDPNGDLRIWRVSGVFPTNAPLYSKSNERGKSFVVIGRGTQRGAEVRVGNKLKGWRWGTWDGVQRWGQNKVNAIVDGGPGQGDMLRAFFTAGGRNKAHLSEGDSGGAVFIKDGKVFKLAGINYSVDGPYNTTNSGLGFDAALFNQRDLYVQPPDGAWELFSGASKTAGSFYATRVSSRLSWITNVLSQPPP